MGLTCVVEVRTYVSMVGYKRNQVEEAIATAFLSVPKPPLELRNKLKRLLDTDRALGRNSRASEPLESTFAFFSDDAPGSGFEVRFAPYEAFALMTSWRLLEHGWPQQTAVEILRQARRELEPEHARILRLDPARLFDQSKIRDKAQPGDPYTGSAEESFLVLLTRAGRNLVDGLSSRSVRVCPNQQELAEFVRGGGAGSWTSLGLTQAAFMLQGALDKTVPSKRGPRGSDPAP